MHIMHKSISRCNPNRHNTGTRTAGLYNTDSYSEVLKYAHLLQAINLKPRKIQIM